MTPVILLEAWGMTLIHVCWQAALLAGLYKLTELFLPGLRHNTRYVLALMALISIGIAALITMVYEVTRLMPDALIPAVEPALPVLALGTTSLTLQSLLPWIEGAWLLGVIALSCRTCAGLWMIHSLKKDAQPVPEAIANRFAWAVRRMGLSGKVSLRLHPRITGPFVIGAVRSVIYLPISAVTALTPDQLDAVLAHELEHIRRADYAWNLVQNVIETLFFFHPAVWWLGSTLREQRELCCDDAALKACTDPLTYATALLSLEEQRRPRHDQNALVMALNGHGDGKTLMGRIARMLGEKPSMPRSKTRPHAAVAVPVILLVVAAFVTPVAQVAASANGPLEGLALMMEPVEEIDAESETEALLLTPADGDIEDDSVWHETDEMDANHPDVPDVIDQQIKAELLAAEAELAAERQMDAEAMASEIKAELENAKAQLEQAGLMNHGIDPEAIAANVRRDLAAARADLMAAQSDKARAIADQARDKARAEARQARDIARSRARQMSFTSVPAVPAPPAPPEPEASPEMPAPLAGPGEIIASPVAWAPAPPAPPAPVKTVHVNTKVNLAHPVQSARTDVAVNVVLH